MTHSPEKLGASYFQDPHPLQARLREEGPVVPIEMPEGFNAWLVTRYPDVRAALADQRLCKDWRKLVPAGAETPAEGSPENMLSVHMLNLDPPDHERVRRLVTKAFTARRVADLRPRVAAITGSLLDELAANDGDTVDLLESFAFPLPITVISELLGIPASDRDKFRAWSDATVSSVTKPEQMQAAAAEMIEYFSAQTEARRRSADRGGHGMTDDLLSALVQAQDEGDRLSTGELISMVFLLLVAGHETTVNLIASGTLALLLDPAAHARLRADRSLLPAAVEEMLRYTSPVNHATFRFTTEPTQLAGVDIPAGNVVVVGLSSANRDGTRFADPDSFDLDRAQHGEQGGGHLAFGHGIHFCLGASLARLEAEIAFGGLLDRFPDMTLAVPESELRWRQSTLIRGLETLPVRLGPA
jgi:cytochrome P450